MRLFFSRRNVKAQAAMEYMHTYGWVILSVIMVGGALVYFDVGGADRLIPEKCSFLSGLGCLDVAVEESIVSIVVVNGFGYTLSNISVAINGTCDSVANTSVGNPYGNLNVLVPNKQATYVFDCQNLSGLGVEERIIFDYTSVESGQQHIKVGVFEFHPGE